MGEEKLKTFINFCLKYIAELDIPVKRWESTNAQNFKSKCIQVSIHSSLYHNHDSWDSQCQNVLPNTIMCSGENLKWAEQSTDSARITLGIHCIHSRDEKP